MIAVLMILNRSRKKQTAYLNIRKGEIVMAVIKTIKKGSGVIRIHDDYCKDNTPEDNQRIVDECSRIILNYYRRKETNLA